MSDIVIRDASIDDCDELGIVMVAGFFSAFLGVVPEKDLDLEWAPSASAAKWREYFTSAKQEGEFLIVAEAADQGTGTVVGLALAGRRTDDARYPRAVSILHVLPTWHRRGIGRRLLAEVAARLMARDERALLIACARENRFRGFYPAVGGMEYVRIPGKIDRYVTEEIQYVWDDVVSLALAG